jgi:hypothetical protein
LDNWTKEEVILLRFLPYQDGKNRGRKNYLPLDGINIYLKEILPTDQGKSLIRK